MVKHILPPLKSVISSAGNEPQFQAVNLGGSSTNGDNMREIFNSAQGGYKTIRR